MLLLTLWSSFAKQVNLSVIARLVSYGLTCAALPILRRKLGAETAGFKAPAGVAVSILTLVLAGWLLSNASWLDARDTAIAATLGLLLYIAYKLTRVGRKANYAG
jgi:amino acid transporter